MKKAKPTNRPTDADLREAGAAFEKALAKLNRAIAAYRDALGTAVPEVSIDAASGLMADGDRSSNRS